MDDDCDACNKCSTDFKCVPDGTTGPCTGPDSCDGTCDSGVCKCPPPECAPRFDVSHIVAVLMAKLAHQYRSDSVLFACWPSR